MQNTDPWLIYFGWCIVNGRNNITFTNPISFLFKINALVNDAICKAGTWIFETHVLCSHSTIFVYFWSRYTFFVGLRPSCWTLSPGNENNSKYTKEKYETRYSAIGVLLEASLFSISNKCFRCSFCYRICFVFLRHVFIVVHITLRIFFVLIFLVGKNMSLSVNRPNWV